MIEHIYNIVGGGFTILTISLIARYVFLEPKWEKWQYYFNIVNVVILVLAEIFIESEARIFICLLCAGVNISLARKKKRIRGFFLVIPIMGICIGVLIPLLFLPELLFGLPEDIYETTLDIAGTLLMILFLWKGKNWRKKFELEIQYRKLQKWESRLLTSVGLILILIMAPISDIAVIADLKLEMKLYVVLSSIGAMVLTCTVVELVMQGNKRAYYENVAAVNESYLNAEVKHFEVYQKAQTETRRVRHDMRNHMQAMLYLVKEEKYEELRMYMEELSSSIEQIDMELHCGNLLADAICNEKNQLARLKGIPFEIEGRMPEKLKIQPVDICTIFANALDNAIEALENEKLKNRWIKLAISCQGEILFLRFTNPVFQTKLEHFYGNTSKQDKKNHGFGLQNIRISAEKYQGEVNATVCEEKGEDIFSLEIMLMNG
ncbi:MAG: sensor histidine kinase [Roseburia sp.]